MMNTVNINNPINSPANLMANPEILPEGAEEVIEKTLQFQQLMMTYNSALKEVRTKIEILNDDLTMRNNRTPIEFITHRIKNPMSIFKKLKDHHLDISLEAIYENLNDIAGIRVICSFVDDIYQVADMLTAQDDITLIEVKDYIKNPKPNGYRSYHMILEVPVFFSERKQLVRVEIQLRTVAMEFWASIEHQLSYKKDIKQSDDISNRLTKCANAIAEIDIEMQNIRKEIDSNGTSAEDEMILKLERLSKGLLKL